MVNRSEAALRFRRFVRTPKALLLMILVPLIAVTAPRATGGAGRAWLVVGVAAAAGGAVDTLCAASRGWGARLPDGAVLTGVLIGMIIDPGVALPTIAAMTAVAILAKHLVRTRRGHMFNPAPLVLVGAGLIGVKAQSWWGVASAPTLVIIPLVIVTGLFITDRVNRLPMVGAFLGTYYGALAVGSFTGAASRVAEAYHAPFVNAVLFAAFVMLTDPPTSPGRRTEQYTYGIIAAATSVVCVVTVHELYFLPLGLLVGNGWLAALRLRQRSAGAAGRRPPTSPATSTSPSLVPEVMP